MFILPFIQMEKGDWCFQELFNMQRKHPTHLAQVRRNGQVCLNSKFSTLKLQLTSYKQGWYIGYCSLSIAVSINSCELLSTVDCFVFHKLKLRIS